MLSIDWWKQALPIAVSGGIPKRALKVALVIGTLLTLINQWELISALQWPVMVKAALTYCVPYLVNTHGAVTARMAQAQAQAKG